MLDPSDWTEADTGEGKPRASQQLVITGRHARRRTVTKWRLAREG